MGVVGLRGGDTKPRLGHECRCRPGCPWSLLLEEWGPGRGLGGDGAPLQLLRPQAQPSDRAAAILRRPRLAPSGASLSLQAVKQEHVMVPQTVLINLPPGAPCLGPELGTPAEPLS